MANQSLPVNFSTLIISLASSAVLAIGARKRSAHGQIEKDLALARFNIDLLVLLKEKTKGNLTSEEGKFFRRRDRRPADEILERNGG